MYVCASCASMCFASDCILQYIQSAIKSSVALVYLFCGQHNQNVWQCDSKVRNIIQFNRVLIIRKAVVSV